MLTYPEIYQKLRLPPNLQEHHYRVASVGLSIVDHWTGPTLDRPVLLEALMTHDLGNIIKFDFQRFPHLLEDNGEGLDYWRQVKQEVVITYGNDVHSATITMAREVGVSEQAIQLLERMGSSHASQTIETGSWEDKVLLYADMRVMPRGIVSQSERFMDLGVRYADRIPHEEVIRRQFFADQIEESLQRHTTIPLPGINDLIVKHNRAELMSAGPTIKG